MAVSMSDIKFGDAVVGEITEEIAKFIIERGLFLAGADVAFDEVTKSGRLIMQINKRIESIDAIKYNKTTDATEITPVQMLSAIRDEIARGAQDTAFLVVLQLNRDGAFKISRAIKGEFNNYAVTELGMLERARIDAARNYVP